MLLKQLIKRLNCTIVNGNDEIEITDVIYDSRKVIKDSVFICVTGTVADGHDYAIAAVEKGATALVVEREIELPEEYRDKVTIVKTEDARYALAIMSAEYFGNPAEELYTIGITGTKGKTTTTYMVKGILEECGYKTGLIGTIETIIGDKRIPASNTTPESYIVQKSFREMVDAGIKAVVMEVSSQGLMMHRCAGFTYDIGVFTNLEPDHIGPGEHASLEEYIACKGLLFKQCKVGIVNCDDEHMKKVIEGHTCKIETYGLSDKADTRATDIELITTPGSLGTKYRVSGLTNMNVTLNLPGMFSVYNSLCAIAISRHFDNISLEKLEDALLNVKVKGRIEVVPVSDKFTLMIDYAHNAMALESILKTLKEYNPKRLVCLFGCGGNRSKLRRFEMGEVSGNLADLTIITSDNPRFEEPKDIINDIITGISKTDGKHIDIEDRREAIKYAITHGEEGDIIVLAGKGHEDYQEIKGKKYPMDERFIIADILKEIGW